jgi:hypothetical protein
VNVLDVGVDTIRANFEVSEVPVMQSYVRDYFLDQGWQYHQKSELRVKKGDFGVPTLYESHAMSYQDKDNSTLRLYLLGGRYLNAEYSVPRLINNDALNLKLATTSEVYESLEIVKDRASKHFDNIWFSKLSRCDLALDLEACEARPAVISASQNMRLMHTKAPVREMYPGETAIIRGRQMSMRCYDKTAEMIKKLGNTEQFADIIKLSNDQGRTRIEFENKMRGGVDMEIVKDAPHVLARYLRHGFDSLQVEVGGLEQLRQTIDALDVAAQTKNSLLAFAVRFAALGHDGMIQAYSRRTFYRHKRRFLDHGLSLDDVCEWQGVVDFEPVVQYLEAA